MAVLRGPCRSGCLGGCLGGCSVAAGTGPAARIDLGHRGRQVDRRRHGGVAGPARLRRKHELPSRQDPVVRRQPGAVGLDHVVVQLGDLPPAPGLAESILGDGPQRLAGRDPMPWRRLPTWSRRGGFRCVADRTVDDGGASRSDGRAHVMVVRRDPDSRRGRRGGSARSPRGGGYPYRTDVGQPDHRDHTPAGRRHGLHRRSRRGPDRERRTHQDRRDPLHERLAGRRTVGPPRQPRRDLEHHAEGQPRPGDPGHEQRQPDPAIPATAATSPGRWRTAARHSAAGSRWDAGPPATEQRTIGSPATRRISARPARRPRTERRPAAIRDGWTGSRGTSRHTADIDRCGLRRHIEPIDADEAEDGRRHLVPDPHRHHATDDDGRSRMARAAA